MDLSNLVKATAFAAIIYYQYIRTGRCMVLLEQCLVLLGGWLVSVVVLVHEPENAIEKQAAVAFFASCAILSVCFAMVFDTETTWADIGKQLLCFWATVCFIALIPLYRDQGIHASHLWFLLKTPFIIASFVIRLPVDGPGRLSDATRKWATEIWYNMHNTSSEDLFLKLSQDDIFGYNATMLELE